MDQIEQYCEHLLSTGRKRSSVRVYRAMLKTCIRTLEEEGMQTDARKIGEGGCDLATLKDLMRHASVNTTLQCYIDVRDKEKDETMRKFATSMGRVLNI